jgi:uncharacterized protein
MPSRGQRGEAVKHACAPELPSRAPAPTLVERSEAGGPLETPCINVCLLDDATGLCAGCGRSIDEIARWSAMSDRERSDIMALLPERVTRLDESER